MVGQHTHTLIIHDALAMMDVVADNPDDIDMEQIELVLSKIYHKFMTYCPVFDYVNDA